jgi:hypothetical protein
VGAEDPTILTEVQFIEVRLNSLVKVMYPDHSELLQILLCFPQKESTEQSMLISFKGLFGVSARGNDGHMVFIFDHTLPVSKHGFCILPKILACGARKAAVENQEEMKDGMFSGQVLNAT